MQKNLLNKKENIIQNAEKYTLKYLNDLQHHFNLTNHQTIKILKNCIFKLKRKHPPKNWWQFVKNKLKLNLK